MFKPTQDYIVVKPEQRERNSVIAMPDEDPCQGLVISVGPGKYLRGKRMPLDVKPGETVRFKYHETYQKFENEGTEYLVIREPDVEMVIE